jgi:2-succinyl-5-enolpyruvyl-6-hydroxy-3-cyclohexene-1-carboxylate synthase
VDGRLTRAVSRDPLYEYVDAFMAELAAQGVRRVFVSPGSRSTPLALTAWARPDLATHVVLDERSAAFVALGSTKASGRPTALVCTSGTAAANYLPAVVEAHHGGVPLLVLTADRPPELRGWGAGQTIDQLHLYGRNVRWFAETPVPTEGDPAHARRLAARALAAATGPDPGPVHVNWPIRKPLEPVGGVGGSPGAAPIRLEGGAVDVTGPAERLAELVDLHERGVIVTGPLPTDGTTAAGIAALASASGWPVLADVASQLRCGGAGDAAVVSTAHHLLKAPAFAGAHPPEVIMRFGGTPISATVSAWIEASPGELVIVDGTGRWEEATFTFGRVLVAPPGPLAALAAQLIGDRRHDGDWRRSWTDADAAARAVLDDALGVGKFLSPQLVRAVGDCLPDAATLYLSNSLPVREAEMFLAASRTTVHVQVHRGANGIDGLTSAAAGAALDAPGPVVLLTGDLAVLHDIGGLVTAGQLGTPLTIVVPDNGGGGIFDHLPIAARGAAVGYTELFRTPHRVDLAALAGLPGVSHTRVDDRGDFTLAVGEALSSPTIDLIVVPIDADADLAEHERLGAAVISAVSGA